MYQGKIRIKRNVCPEKTRLDFTKPGNTKWKQSTFIWLKNIKLNSMEEIHVKVRQRFIFCRTLYLSDTLVCYSTN